MERKTRILIFIILCSVFIGFMVGLATLYMTHKYTDYSLYISIIIGLIISILFFYWCQRDKIENNEIQNKSQKWDKKVKFLFALLIVWLISSITWFISLIAWSIESEKSSINPMTSIAGFIGCIISLGISFSSLVYFSLINKKWKSK